MNKFNIIYEANKELDVLFGKKIDDPDIFRKNVIELLVEIGELANETRCFKYWSIKEPSSKEIILEEYADGLIMILVFASMVEISLDEEFPKNSKNDINDQFLYLYKLVGNLMDNFNKSYVKEILSNFIYLGKLLDFSDEDIINGVLNKIKKNKKRLKESFVN